MNFTRMRKLMVPVFFGECFLVFWNILMVLSEEAQTVTSDPEEDHVVFWEQPIPNQLNNTNFNQYDHLDLDQEFRIYIRDPKNDIGRYMYNYSENESRSIGFIIGSCKAVETQWILEHKPENKTSEATQLEVLAEHRGPEIYIYTGKALLGEYYLNISSESRQFYFMFATMDPITVDLLRQVNGEKYRRAIRFKKDLKKSSVTLQWPEWSWKYENQPVIYVVMWSHKKYVRSSCERENYERDTTGVVTTRKSTFEIYEDGIAIPGELLYVSVFIKDIKSGDEILLPYLQGRVNFQNTQITLKDGTPVKKDLTPDDDRLTFRYKVRKSKFPESVKEILWYVISCDGDVQIEINHKKDVVLRKQVVSGYKVFRIPQPHAGNRYVLKVTDTTKGESEKKVEVFATIHSKSFPFPDVTNFDLSYFPNPNYNVENKISYIVAWNASSDETPVHYCMRVYNKKHEANSDVWETNQCTRMKRKFSNVGGLVFRNCTKSANRKSSIITLPIYDLDPVTDYAVYVRARKQNSKRRLWYNTLHIRGNDFYPGINLSSTT
ncbi:uncharacterized protein nord isoform X2 [Planococcus citri]|uniref:uncharacterized protein nord isoform X2 n=1 Tax=Planococcus citri TaxID=170843 RepID=UPI0031F8F711